MLDLVQSITSLIHARDQGMDILDSRHSISSGMHAMDQRMDILDSGESISSGISRNFSTNFVYKNQNLLDLIRDKGWET